MRMRPKPMPPSSGYQRVLWLLVWKTSERRSGTTPMMGSCWRLRESRTATVTMHDRQSRMKRSVPASKMGRDDTTLVRVLYTSSSLTSSVQ